MAPSVQRRKVWLMSTTRVPCSNAAKTRNPLKFARVPKLANRSQPLVGRSSPYYEDVCRRYRCLTTFFRLSIHALAAKTHPDKVVRWCQNGDFLRPVFSASRVQHISDMHSKFALRPHHVWKYGRHPISDRWDYARTEKEEEKDRRNHRAKNIMSASAKQGGHNERKQDELGLTEKDRHGVMLLITLRAVKHT